MQSEFLFGNQTTSDHFKLLIRTAAPLAHRGQEHRLHHFSLDNLKENAGTGSPGVKDRDYGVVPRQRQER